MKRATRVVTDVVTCSSDFNPHPLWRGRHEIYKEISGSFAISIHTLCEEGDMFLLVAFVFHFLFQSTPSVKRATTTVVLIKTQYPFQSTPSVKRATCIKSCQTWKKEKISIHTLCEEGDFRIFNNFPFKLWFQSTPSVKRATTVSFLSFWKLPISIHTLCEEGDYFCSSVQAGSRYFNPHPLWRGRLWHTYITIDAG